MTTTTHPYTDISAYEIPEAVRILWSQGQVAVVEKGAFCPEFLAEGRTLYVDYVDPAQRRVPSGERFSVMSDNGEVTYAGDDLEEALTHLRDGADAEHVTLTAHTAIMDAFGIGNESRDSFLLAIPLDSNVGKHIEEAIAKVQALEFDPLPAITQLLGRAVIEQARVYFYG